MKLLDNSIKDYDDLFEHIKLLAKRVEKNDSEIIDARVYDFLKIFKEYNYIIEKKKQKIDLIDSTKKINDDLLY
jgi:hypothetical protein